MIRTDKQRRGLAAWRMARKAAATMHTEALRVLFEAGYRAGERARSEAIKAMLDANPTDPDAALRGAFSRFRSQFGPTQDVGMVVSRPLKSIVDFQQ